MKFDLRSQTKQLVTQGKAKLQSIQSFLSSSKQFLSGRLRLKSLATLKLDSRSTVLRLVALGGAAAMAVLVIGSIQTIATGNWTIAANEQSQPDQLPQKTVEKQRGWGGLPMAPFNPPAKSTAPTKALTAKPSPAATAKSIPSRSGAAQPKTATKSSAPTSAPQTQPAQPVPDAPTVLTQASLAAFAPRQESAPADPSNYGDRYSKDVFGKPVQNDPLIVLHETVGSANSAINMFQTPHTDENKQSSYHSIIRRDGTVVYIVPPEKRAYGAGNSIFISSKGQEAVKTHRQFPPSVNNFAYHISLETPPDGNNDAPIHSGYTDAQYRSLAWLVAHTPITDERITTHQAIDRSGSRMDPRSFDTQKFFVYLHSLPRPYLQQKTPG